MLVVAKLFNELGTKLRQKGLIAEVFSFVDASSMISKVSLWDERDKAIKEGEETLNNLNINKFSADKDASYGNKGKTNF